MMRRWLACGLVALGAIAPFLGEGFAGLQARRFTLSSRQVDLGGPEAVVRGSLPGRPPARLGGGSRPAQGSRPVDPGEWGCPADGYRRPDLPCREGLSAAPVPGELSSPWRSSVSRAPPAMAVPLV